jgi:hypothetical protein
LIFIIVCLKYRVCYINSTKEHKSCKDQSYYLHLAMQVKISNVYKAAVQRHLRTAKMSEKYGTLA